MAEDVERINNSFLGTDRNYILVGPGRWGSSDFWLGVPVKWPHISAARVIVEVALKNYRVDPSQGTHFFQNLTSFGVGYFTIDTNIPDGLFRKDILDAMPAIEETQYVRHIRFNQPLRILMDGMKGEGVVVKGAKWQSFTPQPALLFIFPIQKKGLPLHRFQGSGLPCCRHTSEQ